MPSDTFYRLSAEKRRRLTDAIEQELSCVPPSKMSINRIIKAAGIPRGSYYQYFSGPRDILALILNDFRESAQELAERIRKETDGDFYALFDGMFAYVLQYGLSEGRRELFCNLFSEVRPGDIFSALSEHIDAMKERLATLGETRAMVFTIMAAVFKESLAAAFAQPDRAAEITEEFRKKMKLLSEIGK